jgi:hypothetical protein
MAEAMYAVKDAGLDNPEPPTLFDDVGCPSGAHQQQAGLMGFDTDWYLIDLAAYRADPAPPAATGEVWRRAVEKAPWAEAVELPYRHDIGLLMALRDVAGADPTYRAVRDYDRSVYEPGGRFAGATHRERGALKGALDVFDFGYRAAKEKPLVLKALGVKADGALTLLVGVTKLAAVSRWAAVFEEHLAAHEEGWASATRYVERPVFAEFLAILRGLPAGRILVTRTR